MIALTETTHFMQHLCTVIHKHRIKMVLAPSFDHSAPIPSETELKHQSLKFTEILDN